MTTVSTIPVTCDMCGGQLALVTQTEIETLWNCWECQNPVRETPMIIFREYSQLTAEEKQDGIEAARMWLRGLASPFYCHAILARHAESKLLKRQSRYSESARPH